jgi:hopanoid-associated phosphorylase
MGVGAVPQSIGRPVTESLGVVTALEMERRWIGAPEPLVETSGIGAERATAAAGRMLDRGATALVSWGSAGGLDPKIRPGTVVLPHAVIDTAGSRSRVDLEWRDRLVTRIGDRVDVSTSELLSVVRPITSAEEKRELHRRTAAGAVDMESAAIAAVAIQSGISFLAVRVVVDAATVSIPKAALEMFDEGGRLKKSSLIRFVLHPLGWPGLIALARANAAAGRSMRRLWSAAGPDLGLS